MKMYKVIEGRERGLKPGDIDEREITSMKEEDETYSAGVGNCGSFTPGHATAEEAEQCAIDLMLADGWLLVRPLPPEDKE